MASLFCWRTTEIVSKKLRLSPLMTRDIHRLRTIHQPLNTQCWTSKSEIKCQLIPFSSYYMVRHFSMSTASRNIFRLEKVTAEEYRMKDQMGKNHKLVYQAGSVNYVKFGSIGIQALMATLVVNSAMVFYSFGMGLIYSYYLEILGLSTSFLVLSGAIQTIVRSYPLRIYYCSEEDKFTAITCGWHFLAKRYVEMSSGSVSLHKPSFLERQFMPWRTDLCVLEDKRKLIIIADNFVTPVYYNKLLGYLQK